MHVIDLETGDARLLTSAERREEPTIPHENVMKVLRRDGYVSDCVEILGPQGAQANRQVCGPAGGGCTIG